MAKVKKKRKKVKPRKMWAIILGNTLRSALMVDTRDEAEQIAGDDERVIHVEIREI